MRLSLWIFICVFVLHSPVYSFGKAQADKTITLSGTFTLQTIFKKIEKQTGKQVYYSNSILNDREKTTLQISNYTIDQVLQKVLVNKDLEWTIEENFVAIRKKNTVLPSTYTEDTTLTVTGKVVNEKGEPIAGATIIVKGNQKGTTTSPDGGFVIRDVRPNASLVISSIAFLTQEIPIQRKSSLGNISLKNYIGELDETIVLAYGTTTRRMSTGNVGTVKAKDIEKSPVTNSLLAIQGRVPGIFIEQSSGLPGSGVKVRIQGQNSMLKGNDPLYVVDGVPYTSQLLPSLNGILGSSGDNTLMGGSPLNFINPSDIESIDILKDADATSIYGSRAANGAILITTKKGKSGQTRVEINIQNGWGKVTRKMNMMNTIQYLEMRKEALQNDGVDLNIPPYSDDSYKIGLFADISIWNQTRNTDWQKELIGETAQYKDVNIAISGGQGKTTFLLGTNYKKQTTVFPGDLSNRKASVHFNLNNTSVDNRFKLNFTGRYMYDDNQLQQTDLTNTAITLSPNAPSLYDSNGSLNWEVFKQSGGTYASTWINPLIYQLSKYHIKTNALISNATLSYQLLPGMLIKSNFGYNTIKTDELTTRPTTAYAPEFRSEDWAKGSSQFGYNQINTWSIEPQLTYQLGFNKSKIDALLGLTFNQESRIRSSFNASGFTSDLQLEDIKAAPILEANPTINLLYKYNAIFGRLNYSFDNKYILNVTFRRDGSSRFGSKNRFHGFGSIAGAWIFTEENWINKNTRFLSFGKLRVSFGTSGNDQIGDYAFLSLYNPVSGQRGYQGTNGLAVNGLPNAFLQWEETEKLQGGIDLGFLNDRILVNINYFRNRSTNQLLSYPLPFTTGNTNIAANFPATVENQGWEFMVNSVNLKMKHFTWSTNINLTIPKNKLIDFSTLASSSFASRYIIGKSINIQKLYKFGGVDPATGLYQFIDKDGKITSEAGSGTANKIAIVDPNPKFYGGLQNSFSCYGFQLDVLFQFVKQFGENYIFGRNPGQFNTNQPVALIDRWQKTGDIGDIQRYDTYFVTSINKYAGYARQSDKAFSDASYIRLKNLSLSWSLPENLSHKAKFKNAKIYIQGQNLLTFTNYAGLDPETRSVSSLPPLRILTIGILATL